MCDPQIGFDNYQADLERFERAVEAVNKLPVDFVVICGDLVNSANKQSWRDFNSVRAKLRVPAYCAPGNHDVGNKATASSLRQFRKNVGKDYFYFDHKGCRFIVLNTQLWKAPLPRETQKQDEWLRRTLHSAASKHLPVFVVEHYPPLLKSVEEPEAYFNLPLARRRELLNEFKEAGVVAVLAGHTHTTSTNRVGAIEIVTSETTSKNFDKRPFGFRVWRVEPNGNYSHSFLPLPQPDPN